MQIIKNLNIQDILFLDIETVSEKAVFEELDTDWQKFWEQKAKYIVAEDQYAANVYDRGAIYAEFGKIICIGVGIVRKLDGNNHAIKLKTFAGHDEKVILMDFAKMLNQYFDGPPASLCAHNGKEFDFPFIARRMVVHGITLPKLLDNAGKKPWEMMLFDTMELWKFGDYKNYTSLALLAKLFNIPTPKDDIDGSMVGPTYWKENDLERICNYCCKDVLTLARIFLQFRNEGGIKDSEVIWPNSYLTS